MQYCIVGPPGHFTSIETDCRREAHLAIGGTSRLVLPVELHANGIETQEGGGLVKTVSTLISFLGGVS